jgi:hypothetical protein
MRNPFNRANRVTAETARKITGISGPFGGVQWADPGPSDHERVRHFLVELEDRSVLYNPDWLEVRSQVDQSIVEIRRICTAALKNFSPTDFATVPIKNIRAACRRYRDESQIAFRHVDLHSRQEDMSAGAFLALGAFRAAVGQEVARLSSHYDIEIEGDLATVMPELDDGR